MVWACCFEKKVSLLIKIQQGLCNCMGLRGLLLFNPLLCVKSQVTIFLGDSSHWDCPLQGLVLLAERSPTPPLEQTMSCLLTPQHTGCQIYSLNVSSSIDVFKGKLDSVLSPPLWRHTFTLLWSSDYYLISWIKLRAFK